MKKPKKPLFSIPGSPAVKAFRTSHSGVRARKAEAWLGSLMPNPRAGGERVELELNRKPLVGIGIGLALMLGLLLYQLFSLQIVSGERYRGLADGNRLRSKVSYAQRGRILDRNGVALVDNIPSFQLIATPYLLPRDEAARLSLYQKIAAASQIPVAEIQQKAEAKGLEQNQPVLVRDNINYNQALLLQQKIPDITGFSLDGLPVRQYKSDSGLSNILGYVGRVNEDELKRTTGLLPIDFIGKDGVESQYDSLLRGRNGVVETEVDSRGRPIRVLAEQAAEPGKDVTLTIDYGLQQQFAAAIGRAMVKAGSTKAAGVAMDPNTGEVLASVSLPSFDNNLFTGGISQGDFAKLNNDTDQPLVNKVINGLYPSGSIIKPLHLSGALQEGVVNENTTFVDKGLITVPSEVDPSVVYTFRGWQPGGLGPMNARRAVAMSSDIYFYTVGGGYQGFKGLGVDRLTKYYKLFGLGSLTGVDLPGEAAGRVPTPEWKKKTTGEDWFIGDTYNISIGQGDILVSPMQMAVAESAVANGGKLLVPHIFKQGGDGSQGQTKVVRQDFIKPQNLQIVREGMRQVIGGTTSTATFANVPVQVAGKSGTAETDPTANKKPHAWYVAYAPYNSDKPAVMFALILEGGEGGSAYAAPAISEAMQWYFKNRPQTTP